ncbi:MAG TPA: ThuA domain-containing protein [Clostridiales bacterium]|nr:ThuA domain-containing protein [Clostridiales bacterium]HQK73330.1 ThuA domain-containing protein [Clostridiales bacterium]
MSGKKALIVYGGWEGHEPELVSQRFKKILEDEGIEVTLSDTLEAYADADFLKTLHLIVPIWTGGKLSGELCSNVSKALASGVGMAGNHGGMCDSFRENTEWQFITGGNWISHPGGLIDYTVNIVKNSSSPIVEGIEDFSVFSEQYYLHFDPSVEILATTRFPLATYYHCSNKPVDMPVVWTKKWGHGRVFYTSLGHTDIVFEDAPASQEIMRRGMLWAIEGKDIAIARNLDPAVFESNAKMY